MNQQAKNKNPLLSCALSNFEDLSTGIVLTTAEKPVFTIGNAPVITDTDNFSEVSLDRDGNSSEVGHSDLQADMTSPFYTSPLADLDSYSNLQTLHDLQQQPPPTLDINSNNQESINDGNINPIAAFGTAASTVFSTFSSIIKGSTSQTKIEDQSTLQQQMPPFSNNDTYQDSNNINTIPPSNPYGFNLQPDPNAPLPSFFSPDDNLVFSKQTKVDAPSNNTFRLGGNKKKTYAHIPGLSSTQTQSQNVPQNFNLNPVMPPLPPQPITHVDSMPNFQPPPPLQSQQNYYENNVNQQQMQASNMEKTTNKFSFSSLLDKIPVSMNLFGGSEQNNSNESNYNNNYQNNDVNQVTAQTTAAMFQPQTESINYFSPQTQMTEPQIINPVQQQTTVNDYFNNIQPNFASPGITTTDSIDIIQNTNVTQILPENNIQTVNFFNPQQFNTKPFAKVQQPPAIQQQGAEIQKNNDISSVMMTSSPAPPMMPLNQFIQTTPMPQNYSTPPITTFNTAYNETTSADISAPPVFFNPAQASELFKSRQSDEGKPKNPYSNNRMRGVGLYRVRTSSSSDSTSAQQLFMPTAPSPQLIAPFQEQENIIDHPKESSRPPSIPLIEQNTLNMTPSTITNFIQSPPQVMNFNMPQQAVTQQLSQQNDLPPPVVQKKSDLNVPDNENTTSVFEQEQKIHEPKTNVSNFFAYENNNNNKVNEQVSALSFFQVQPEIDSQPVVDSFSIQKHDKLASYDDSLNAINFFISDTPKNESVQQCIDENNKMDEVNKKEEIQEFNTPITSSTMQGSDLANDITDKMESLSACSRSTLSLFATSELDSTMGQKLLSSAPVESLIPKYLEQQPPIGENLKTGSRAANESHIHKYRPIYCHWFYQNIYWHPFSMSDSMAIDQAIGNGDDFVCTSGGRFEVNIKDRRRSSIYWTSGSNAIRKCSWFYMDEKNGNQNLIPYEENVAEYLEKEYEKAITHGSWNHKIHLPNSNNDIVIMKSSGIIEHHKMEQILVVKRGIDEFDIDDGEEGTADHLILCISGFGDKIDENADEVRSKCMETIQQYYSEAFDRGQIKRIEVLPIILNSIDVLKMYEINNEILNALPFKSLSREINENIMRTMLYSNENFYQKIMNHLAFSLNEIVSKFKQRNVNFDGEIMVMSSSFEALFLFDMLADDGTSEFWKLNFEISQFFGCGIPTNLLMIRNGEKLKHGFELKRCKKFLNILHPADDIAQRIEPLVTPENSKLPPESIENLMSHERIDFILPEDSNLDKFNTSKYFSSEILIRRITNQIYGANHIEMDSGSL